MIGFLKNRYEEASPAEMLPGARGLGNLEMDVMAVLWQQGESNVRDVVRLLARPLAYTTVMTTLDRLFKKGILVRRKHERAFVYSPKFTQQEWERKRAGDFLAGFLSGPVPSRDLLISCLLEAVSQQDRALLDELERQIRSKRKDGARKDRG